MKKKVAFICVHNSCRSQIAEALGNHLRGDAYEYLMSMYASNAGKSGGEFFTPQEVSELLTRIAIVGKAEVNKIYEIIVQSLIQRTGIMKKYPVAV